MRIHPGTNEPDDRAALPDGLVVIQHGFGRFEPKLYQPLEAPGLSLPKQRLAADEAPRLVPFDREAEAGLQRRILIGNVVAPMPIRFFDAQRIQRMIARMDESVAGTRA